MFGYQLFQLVYESVFVSVSHCFYYYGSVINPKGSNGNSPITVLIDCFDYLGPFVIPYEICEVFLFL